MFNYSVGSGERRLGIYMAMAAAYRQIRPFRRYTANRANRNDDAEAKSKTGAEWAGRAGAMYKYFMVFETKRPGCAGSSSHDEFMDIMRGMKS